MQLSIRAKRVVVIAGIALAGLALDFFWGDTGIFRQLTSDSALPPEETKGSFGPETAFIVPKNSHLDTSSYSYCEVLMEQANTLKLDWFKSEYESWERYLEQDYSLDEITLIVEHLSNDNFNYAANFRAKQLKQHSQLAQKNTALMAQLKDEYPDVPDNLTVSFPVPYPSLKAYLSLTKTKRKKLLQETTVTVDDVAYFIQQKEISSDTIIELLSAVSDPSATVGYSKLEATSLIDYAAQAARPEVVSELLQLGVEPTSDPYLGSTMEWALTKLYSYWHKPQRDDAVAVVTLLQQSGAQAQLGYFDNKVEGYFPRRFYSFDQQKLDLLIQQYGLDLTTIEPKPTLNKLQSDHSLLVALKRQRQLYLSEQLQLARPETVLSDCSNTLDALSELWQPRLASNVIQQVTKEHKGDKQAIIQKLATIDPSLVDEYRRDLHWPSSSHAVFDNSQEIFSYLKNLEIDKALTVAASRDLNEANKRWLVHQILGWDTGYYDELFEYGLITGQLDFKQLSTDLFRKPKSLNSLLEAGADLVGHDALGKPLLYYVVEKSDVELLSYMVEEGYPFATDGLGEDPLHKALNSTWYKFSQDKAKQLVDLLMSYHPEVDEFHLRHMALIQLKYPALYQSIVSDHSELAVTDATKLPLVR